MTNAWGSVVGHLAGVISVKDLFYISTGGAVAVISEVGFKMIEIFDGNLMSYSQNKEGFNNLLSSNDLKLLAVYSGADFIYKEIIEEEYADLKYILEGFSKGKIEERRYTVE